MRESDQTSFWYFQLHLCLIQQPAETILSLFIVIARQKSHTFDHSYAVGDSLNGDVFDFPHIKETSFFTSTQQLNDSVILYLNLTCQFWSDLIEFQLQEGQGSLIFILPCEWLYANTLADIGSYKFSQIFAHGDGAAIQFSEKGAFEYFGIDADVDCLGGILGQRRRDIDRVILGEFVGEVADGEVHTAGIDMLCDDWQYIGSCMGLNRLINERVGLGAFQLQAFLVLCLVDMNDGVELVLSSFLNPIIRVVFPQATPAFIELLASIFYVGILVGSLTSGALADKYGRKKLIAYGAVLQIGVSLLFYYAVTLEMMLILRFCYGFSFGFTVAVTTSMFAQISPQEYRGKGILLINFCISIGKLYAVMLGHFFLEEQLAETDWKLMMICGSLPNVLVFLGAFYILEESPRYLLVHQQIDKGLFVVEIMLRRNGKQPLTLAQEEEIRAEFQEGTTGGSDQTVDYHSFKAFLHQDYIKKIVALVLCWIIINFCFYGQLVIQAFHLSTNSSALNLSKYFWTVAGQIPSLLVSFYLIDHPNFGRRKSLILFFLGAAFSHFAFAATTIVFLGSLARFFMKDVFQILYPLTTESFDTRVRSKGFGMCSGGGRIGSIVMPFVVMPLDRWKRGSVYVLFGIISIVAAGIGYGMVQETMEKRLDSTGSEAQPEQLKEVLNERPRQS